MSSKEFNATFVEPMLLLSSETLPDAQNWSYELKLDGYRALGIKAHGRVQLRSRNNKDFAKRYPSIAKALEALPADTVVDGEIVALDEQGRPSFNLLQNYQSAGNKIVYFLFDVLALSGRNIMNLPLRDRRVFLHRDVLPTLGEPIRECPVLNAGLTDVIQAIRKQGLEGIVAKNLDSLYEPGQRSGSWRKMRINKGQEFVIGGYTVAAKTFDALIFGYYKGPDLLYAGRTRNGFTPELREQLQRRFRSLGITECPFVNLPEEHAGRWGAGLTAEKMKECCWVRPELVGQFEFVEWTPDDHLRHSRFVGLRDDVAAKNVNRQ